MKAELIVCEVRPYWAVALRRELTELGPRVGEVRSASECWQRLSASPASLIVWEGTRENRALLAEQLVMQGRSFPLSRCLVVCARVLRHYDGYWREAGAIHVAWSPRSLAQVARIIERHLAARAEPPRLVDELIWAELPWAEEATVVSPAADTVEGS